MKRIKIRYYDFIQSLKDDSSYKDVYFGFIKYNSRHKDRTLNQNAYAWIKSCRLINKALLFSNPEIGKVLKTEWVGK